MHPNAVHADSAPGSASGRAAGSLYRLVSTRADAGGTEVFASSEHVASPWGPDLQHAGPVAGLLVRAMERTNPREGTRLGRISVDLLGAVPMSELHVRAWVERPGRRIELLAAEITAADRTGTLRPVARAHGWRLQTSDTADVQHLADPPLPVVSAGAQDLGHLPFPDAWQHGFVDALEWQVPPAADQLGTTTGAWMRLRMPLVEGEEPTDLERVSTIVDVANGLGARLDAADWMFLNTELTIHLFQPPAGEWVGLTAETSVGSDGLAMSSGVIHSAAGPIGRVTQNVLVERRPQ